MNTGRIVNQRDMDRLFRQDKAFREIYDKYGPPPDWSRDPGFVSLCAIILEQQVSLVSARAHFNKLQSYIGEFTPSAILILTDEEMRNCQISRQKARYLKALSEAILEGAIDLMKLPGMNENEIRALLGRVKGIGKWTSDIYLMFCLQAKDIFPIGDIAVVNTVKELFEVESREEITVLSERWIPVRSLAAFFLWHYYLKKRNRRA